MPSTTNTQTVAPSGLLATSLLSGMATNTAPEPIRSCKVARNVVIPFGGYRFVLAFEGDTSNTARGPYAEAREPTGIGWPVVKAHVLAAMPSAGPRGFKARDGIFELKRLTGFTWEELAVLLSVTRRSLHLWANGSAINTANERHLRGLLMAMRELDRGSARENRALLLAPLRDGDISVGDLLRSRQFGDAVALAGRGRGRVAPPSPSETLWKPEKLSVADRLGTSADRIHTDEVGSLPRRRGPRRGV
jgi:hypothetical protein